MEIKMCVYCEYCEHEEGYMVSEITGWQEGSYGCNKGHLGYESEDDIEGWALKAMDCSDYELSHKVQKELDKRAKQ